MYLAHYTKRFIPEFDAECRMKDSLDTFQSQIAQNPVLSIGVSPPVLTDKQDRQQVIIDVLGTLYQEIYS